jgi:hypothetical protein
MCINGLLLAQSADWATKIAGVVQKWTKNRMLFRAVYAAGQIALGCRDITICSKLGHSANRF